MATTTQNAALRKTLPTQGAYRGGGGSGARGVDADKGEVAVALGHVEAVADDERRRDVEADVAEVDLGALDAVPDQQGAHLERRRAAGQQGAAQVGEGEAAVDDVLDD